MAKAAPTTIVSNWSTLIENLETSPLGFFDSVETAIKKREIPNVTMSRVDHYEGGIVSDKREYLRISCGEFNFDICAAPYGTGFLVSWWLGRLTAHPLAIIAIIFGYLIVLYMIAAAFGLTLAALSAVGIPLVAFVVGVDDSRIDRHLRAIPFVGGVYRRFFRPDTLYRLDTETMFRTATHAAVLETVDALMNTKGLRLLSELERRPNLRQSFRD